MSREVVYGFHAVNAVLEQAEAVITVFAQKNRNDARMQAILALAKAQGVDIQFCDQAYLDQLTQSTQHQGIALTQATASIQGEAELIQWIETLTHQPFLLLLDGVQDPHNLGACLRSAYAFGVDAVIIPKDRSVGLTPTVRKSACGAAEQIHFFQVTNLVRTIEQLKQKNIWFYGADSNVDTLTHQVKYEGAIAWVLGAEGKGLREHTKKACDFLVKIPMQNPMQSLNVSVACGICLFVTRQLYSPQSDNRKM